MRNTLRQYLSAYASLCAGESWEMRPRTEHAEISDDDRADVALGLVEFTKRCDRIAVEAPRRDSFYIGGQLTNAFIETIGLTLKAIARRERVAIRELEGLLLEVNEARLFAGERNPATLAKMQLTTTQLNN